MYCVPSLVNILSKRAFHCHIRDAAEVKGTLTGLLQRLHVLVIGPGLGREPYMQNFAKMAVGIAKEQVRRRQHMCACEVQ